MTSNSSKRGLYVHIPFCRQKCHYCDFVITTKRDRSTIARYLDALFAEAEYLSKKYGRLKFSTLYYGGGTPSELSSSEFHVINETLRQFFDFTDDCEVTAEINPANEINTDLLKCFTRISVGVQAAQDDMLRTLNRPHGKKEIEATFGKIKKAGIKNFSVDLILALPSQTLAQVRESVEFLLKHEPAHFSVYDLDVHEKTVFGLRRREGRLNLPSESEHAAHFDWLVKRLEKAGYMHYELLSFAQPGFESRHNTNYWHNGEYLGLGPGAFSYLNQTRFQYADSVENYFKKIAAGDWTNFAEDQLNPEEIEKESFLTGMRLIREGVDLRQLPLWGVKFENSAVKWLQDGFLEKDGFRLKLTAKGKPVAELILREFAQIS